MTSMYFALLENNIMDTNLRFGGKKEDGKVYD